MVLSRIADPGIGGEETACNSSFLSTMEDLEIPAVVSHEGSDDDSDAFLEPLAANAPLPSCSRFRNDPLESEKQKLIAVIPRGRSKSRNRRKSVAPPRPMKINVVWGYGDHCNQDSHGEADEAKEAPIATTYSSSGAGNFLSAPTPLRRSSRTRATSLAPLRAQDTSKPSMEVQCDISSALSNASPIDSELVRTPPRVYSTNLATTSSATVTITTPFHQSNPKSLINSPRTLKADGTPAKPRVRPTYEETGSPSRSTSPDSQFHSPCATRKLEARMLQLFPEIHASVRILSCILPRLVASFSLHHDSQSTPPGHSPDMCSVKRRKRENPDPPTSTAATQRILAPAMPLLYSLIRLELALLQDPATANASRQPVTRKVHFAAFDGSALHPPSDVIQDSHHHQQLVIHCLREVRCVAASEEYDAIDSLKHITHYLRFELRDLGHHKVCAESLSWKSDFPVQRILKAANSYAGDFQRLIEGDGMYTLSWSQRLADASAQLVRYWLRTELNPVPDRAPSFVYSEDWNLRFCDVLVLEPDNCSPVAVEDVCLSSLVSNAASHIFHFFGGEWRNWKTVLNATPADFCSSPLCHLGIASSGKRRDSGPLRRWSSEEWTGVEVELERATGFLAAVNGAHFLYQLLSLLAQYPKHLKNWNETIVCAAGNLEDCRDALQYPDTHLEVLGLSPTTLLEQLPCIIDWNRKQECLKGLNSMSKRFLFGSGGSKIRRKRTYQPHVGHLERSWEQAMAKCYFPGVARLENDEDGE